MLRAGDTLCLSGHIWFLYSGRVKSNSPVLKSLLSAKVVDSLRVIPLLELNPTLKIKNMSLLGLSIPSFRSYCLEAQVS